MIVGVGSRPLPHSSTIYGFPISSIQHVVYYTAERCHVGFDWEEQLIVLWCKCDNRLGMLCCSGNENRGYMLFVTGFMKVLQIQGVVPDLINSTCAVFAFTDFKLKNKDDCVNEKNNVNTPTHAWNRVFKIYRATIRRENITKNFDFGDPRITLCVDQ